MKQVLMVAAENGAFKGAKVGGMADVIRDLPQALLSQDVRVHVAMPSYGFLAAQEHGEKLNAFSLEFAGGQQQVSVYRVNAASKEVGEGRSKVNQTKTYLFDHPLFNDGGQIYSHGDASRPFAADASKFAFFSLCVAKALVLEIIPRPDVLHLHDWHAGTLALLRHYVNEFSSLKSLPCVYSIHNLGIQGLRPLSGDQSSLFHWFSHYGDEIKQQGLSEVIDPTHSQCYNPMRAGIVLSDKVHLVSPSYAKEVLLPSAPEKGSYCGEGLEQDLQLKQQNGQVFGILNGCFYDENQDLAPTPWVEQAEATLLSWQGLGQHQVDHQYVRSVDQIALQRINRLLFSSHHSDSTNQTNRTNRTNSTNDTISTKGTDKRADSRFLLTSVGRLTDQKVLILRQTILSQTTDKTVTVLEAILQCLKRHQPNGLFVMLGSGDVKISQEFQMIASRYANFIFLNGYDEPLANTLYRQGHLFLMPSSFEPCGISQMLAMAQGQPCLVHSVGGLKDTVQHGVTGWHFSGDDLKAQGEQLIMALDTLLDSCQQEGYGSQAWKRVCANAKEQRFDWPKVAEQYCQSLYNQ
ncbi:glycogen synthase [Shewanella sp.]|uniref:glycogen synthase n=1 Tax=Shewanella sp. TaxID=50422 RepID=UPI004053D8E1